MRTTITTASWCRRHHASYSTKLGVCDYVVANYPLVSSTTYNMRGESCEPTQATITWPEGDKTT